MIKKYKLLKELEKKYIVSDDRSFEEKLIAFEVLYEEAKSLGVFGVNFKISENDPSFVIARVVNSFERASKKDSKKA